MNSPAKPMLAQLELDEKENFSPAQIERFRSDPEFYNRFVKTIEKDVNGAFAMVKLSVSPAQNRFC
jgi:hypothetical protein